MKLDSALFIKYHIRSLSNIIVSIKYNVREKQNLLEMMQYFLYYHIN